MKKYNAVSLMVVSLFLLLNINSLAQSDAFDEKIRDATNGLNRYERLQRSEKILAEYDVLLAQINSNLQNHDAKLKNLEDLKKQTENLAKSISETKTIVDELKKTVVSNNVSDKTLTKNEATSVTNIKNQPDLILGLVNEINLLKEENSKQVDLIRKQRLDLEAIRLELRELSKLIIKK